MAKYIKVIAFIIVYCVTGCDNYRNNLKIKNFENVFEKDQEIMFNDKADMPTVIADTKNYSDSLIYIVDPFKNALYKYDILRKTVDVVGRYGKGIAEYENPFTIAIKRDRIYVNEMNSNKILIYDISNRYITSFSPSEWLNGSLFDIVKDTLLYYLDVGGKYYIKNTNKDKYYQKPILFDSHKYMVIGRGGVFCFNDTVYAVGPHEWKLYKISLLNNNAKIVDLKGLPATNSIDKYHKIKMSKDKLTELIRNNDINSIERVAPMIINNKLYIIISSKHIDSDERIYSIYNTEGYLVANIDWNNAIYVGSCNNKAIFLKKRNGVVDIVLLCNIKINK